MIRNWQSSLSESRPRERRRAGARRGRVWAPEGLEERVLMSGLTYTVDATTDTGAGSGTSGDLRYTITQADLNPGSTIQFAVSGTIVLDSQLPDITANMTIDGPGASNLTIQQTATVRMVWVDGATVSISGLTMSDGRVTNPFTGGGIYNEYGTVTITDCTFAGNNSGSGGAIENQGWLTIDDSVFSGNTSSGSGGGAIWNVGTMTVTNSTFSNNSANFSGGAITNDFKLTVSGCTFSGNTVGVEGRGGAIDNFFATVTITNSTFVNNSATLGGGLDDYYSSASHGASPAIATLTDVTMTGSSGGGIDNEGDTVGDLTLVNSLIAGNGSQIEGVEDGDVIGLVNPFGSTNNLIGDGSQASGIGNGSDGNQVGTSANPLNAKLGTLANNGGSTQTLALLAGSPALDGGSGTATTDTDQRGVPRGHVLDIGAYQATATGLTVAGYPSPTAPGASHALTVTAVDAFGQSALDWSGPVTFSSTDPSATLPTGQSLVEGQGTFGATLSTAGTQSITASAGGLSGSQTGITVSGTTATASFIKTDTTTQGNWSGTYGSQGYNVIGYTASNPSYPSYATVIPSGESTWNWANNVSGPIAPQNPSSPTGSGNRIADCWYASNETSFTVDVDLTDGQAHDLELYLMDWPNVGRSETVTLSNATTGAVLSTEAVSSFADGVYLDWTVSGSVVITITNQGAGPNPVLSGLFFDPATAPTAATASFIKTDTTTQGNWSGTYGSQGYNVIGYTASNPSYPSYATVIPSGELTHTWANNVSGPACPELVRSHGSSNRVADCWYASNETSFTVDVDLTDGQAHDLELYLMDWPNVGRSETVTLSNATTGAVLSTEAVSSFANGLYLDWEISGQRADHDHQGGPAQCRAQRPVPRPDGRSRRRPPRPPASSIRTRRRRGTGSGPTAPRATTSPPARPACLRATPSPPADS